MIPIFIPSYKRANNLKTVSYFLKRGYDAKKIFVVIDNETSDISEYERQSKKNGFNLRIFDIKEGREKYDFVHRASLSRRAAGLSRNMFYDIAENEGIKFYCVQDDDTSGYEIKTSKGVYLRTATLKDIQLFFEGVKKYMEHLHIGCFGLSQTGDFIGGGEAGCKTVIRKKVMNTTFINTDYIYKGERGVQDDDTSQFVGIHYEGYFTGSMSTGLVLLQTQSCTQQGGLTELYEECKLLNKALVVPIQYPSCAIAEKQVKNGGRIHHRINYRYLCPKILRIPGAMDNIAWDTYASDGKFTNEPQNR